jgi:hypothetical protein
VSEKIRRDFARAYVESRIAASSPQNFGLAMASLFDRKAKQFFFVRAREWRGLIIVAPRVFWQPDPGEFASWGEIDAYWLTKWPEEIENARILS